jgi:hypothetical protein
VHELIVGLAAMHSGWFPAFAVALITLVIGMLIGFPPVALALLVGFSAATGPAFADMGYDLKAGYMLRGYGSDRAFERDGRRQQRSRTDLSPKFGINLPRTPHQQDAQQLVVFSGQRDCVHGFVAGV